MRVRTRVAAGLLMLAGASVAIADDGASMDAATVERFAHLALECVHQEYPNKIAHVLSSDEDVAPPRELTPAFYGCFDWHSSVHGHWLLARLARMYPDAELAGAARAALGRSLTAENLAARGRLPGGRGAGDLRAALRARLAALPGGGAARLGGRRRRSSGPRTSPRWRPRRGAHPRPGSRSFTTRSGSASTARRPSPWG